LRRLYLHSNKLNRLPQEIGELRQLQYLDISRNQPNMLPDSITRLHNLQYLNIRANQQFSLPRAQEKFLQGKKVER